MGRPQQHLADVVRFAGTGDATAELRNVLRKGLVSMNAEKRAARIAERGTDAKQNPHVSDAGKCQRAVVFSLLNVPESDPITEDSLMNFLVGNAVEEAWAQILTAAGDTEHVREERVEIPTGNTKVTGRKDFDGVRLLWRGSVVELKSSNSRAMSFMLKSGQQGRAEHRKQINLYLHSKGGGTGYLVYVVKDATKGEPIIHAFRVDYDEAMALSDLGALAAAYDMAKSGSLPAIPEGYDRTKFPCTYCNHRGNCWSAAKLPELLAATIQAKQEAANA
jgi:hypothetical protein